MTRVRPAGNQRADAEKVTKIRSAKRPRIRLVRPGKAFCSAIAVFQTQQTGGQDRRSRGVPAHADDDGGLKRAEDPEGGDQAARDFEEGWQNPDWTPPLQAFHLQRPEGETESAQDLLFQPPFRADEQNAVFRVSPEELLGDRDPREEMAARPAAGDDHPDAAAIRRRAARLFLRPGPPPSGCGRRRSRIAGILFVDSCLFHVFKKTKTASS